MKADPTGRLRFAYETIAELEGRITELEAQPEHPAAQPVLLGEKDNKDPAFIEASKLAHSLFKKHFAHKEPYKSGKVTWGLCDSTAGIISQIDNMVCGLKEPPAQPAPKKADQMLAHVEAFAAKCGWTPDSKEGAFECIQRTSYAQGVEDALAQPTPLNEREEFETWADDQWYSLRKIHKGEDGSGYLDLRTEGAWESWQACVANAKEKTKP